MKLTYGDLTFGPAGWQTLDFRQEPVYDPSGADFLYNKITITGECILTNAKTFDWQPVITVGTGADAKAASSPAQSVPTLRTQFLRPRQTLSFKNGNLDLIPHTSTIDAKLGPKPLYFECVSLQEAAFLCRLGIEAHFVEGTPNEAQGNILSHRWEDEVRIDPEFLSTKTRTGSITVDSRAFLGAGNSTDGLRETLACVSIPPGFTRADSQYKLSKDGCTMTYRLVDTEQFRVPPPPATTADGDLTISCQRMGSPGRFATSTIKLRGPKRQDANQLAMINLATAIAFQQLRDAGTVFPISGTFRRSTYRNEVSCSIQARLDQKKAKTYNLLVGLSAFGVGPMFSDDSKVPDPGTRGTANLLLHAAALYDPVLAQKLNPKTNTLDVTATGGPGNQAPFPAAGLIPGG